MAELLLLQAQALQTKLNGVVKTSPAQPPANPTTSVTTSSSHLLSTAVTSCHQREHPHQLPQPLHHSQMMTKEQSTPAGLYSRCGPRRSFFYSILFYSIILYCTFCLWRIKMLTMITSIAYTEKFEINARFVLPEECTTSVVSHTHIDSVSSLHSTHATIWSLTGKVKK